MSLLCSMLDQGSHETHGLGLIKIAAHTFGLPRGSAKGRLFSLVENKGGLALFSSLAQSLATPEKTDFRLSNRAFGCTPAAKRDSTRSVRPSPVASHKSRAATSCTSSSIAIIGTVDVRPIR